MSEDEPQKRCRRCLEWWPADLEFYYRDGHGGLAAMCKACWAEWRRERRARRGQVTPA